MFIIGQICLMLIFSGILAILSVSVTKKLEEQAYYLDLNTDPGAYGVIIFIRFYLILNNYVPISIILVLDISKMILLKIIEQDSDMISDQILEGCEIHDFRMLEDTGIVDYVFTDKTGTLTCNRLNFMGLTTKDSNYHLKEEEDLYHMKQKIQTQA